MGELPGWVLTLLVGGGVGVALGIFVARKSAARKPIQGGLLAHLFHYLGTVAVISPAPLVLVGAFVYRLPFAQNAGLCLGSLALGFVLLMVFAYFELQTGRKSQDAGT